MPQDPDTQRWPISCITDEMYKKFREMLETVILTIPQPFPIRSIPQKLEDGNSLIRESLNHAIQKHILEKLRELDTVDDGIRETQMTDIFMLIKHEEIVYLGRGIASMTLERRGAANFCGQLRAPLRDDEQPQRRVQRTPGCHTPEVHTFLSTKIFSLRDGSIHDFCLKTTVKRSWIAHT
ncbi:hypothetical protein D9619_011816 [Psilocybe cf. subviscida]|uniref:Uncharacterized protein n=1 Tax=Psilocybe cf. subviscida TaxID=2480587 RepID=A0A8H5B0L9_9AGAR|nr:hypothetical protein D9619_011816 [Psilocybe cf. subviscida]